MGRSFRGRHALLRWVAPRKACGIHASIVAARAEHFPLSEEIPSSSAGEAMPEAQRGVPGSVGVPMFSQTRDAHDRKPHSGADRPLATSSEACCLFSRAIRLR